MTRRTRTVAMLSLASALALPSPVGARQPWTTGSTSPILPSANSGKIGEPSGMVEPGMEATRKAGVKYAPVAFSELPGWEGDDHLAALKAFIASCPRIIELRSAANRRSGGPLTPPELAAACEKAMALPNMLTRATAKAFLEAHFMPHRVVHRDVEGLVTGYYEPLLDGSRLKQGRFQTPILRRPQELVTLVKETSSAKVAARSLTHARRMATGHEPFHTRAEIVAGALDGRGLELLYLESPVDLFFLQIQGSGRVRLTDGTIVRVNYDGKNGHPYTSIGRYLIDNGIVAADKMSMGALGKWLKSNLTRAHEIMNKNASYVFFKETPADGEGPPGAIQVPLVAGRSLAVDPSVHALGSPIYVSAPTLKPAGHARVFNRLMVAHDVGAAIKGPERGDLYFGSGVAAGRTAGRVRHAGNFFVFLSRVGQEATAKTGRESQRRRGQQARQ